MKYLSLFVVVFIYSCTQHLSQEKDPQQGKLFRSRIVRMNYSLLLAEAHKEEDSLVRRVILEMSDSIIHNNITEYTSESLVIGKTLKLLNQKGTAHRLRDVRERLLRYQISLEKIRILLQEEILRRESYRKEKPKIQKSLRTLARLFLTNR